MAPNFAVPKERNTEGKLEDIQKRAEDIIKQIDGFNSPDYKDWNIRSLAWAQLSIYWLLKESHKKELERIAIDHKYTIKKHITKMEKHLKDIENKLKKPETTVETVKDSLIEICTASEAIGALYMLYKETSVPLRIFAFLGGIKNAVEALSNTDGIAALTTAYGEIRDHLSHIKGELIKTYSSPTTGLASLLSV